MVAPYVIIILAATVSCAPRFEDDYDFSLTSVTKAPSSQLKQDNETECQTSQGMKGICVQSYQCNSKTGEVIVGGEDIIDIRSLGCTNPSEVCCLDDPLVNKFGDSDNNVGCGMSKSFDTNPAPNGTAKFGEFPWVVALLNRTSVGDWSDYYFGVGVLIHPSVVATIAHKFDQNYKRIDVYTASEAKVRAGEFNALSTSEPHPHQERNVQKIIMHEQYRSRTIHYDLALLVLESPFDMSAPHIGVACLAATPIRAPQGTHCVGSGWGTTDFESQDYSTTLKKVTLPLVDPDVCQTQFRRSNRYGSYYILNPSLICAGGQNKEDLCRGDGGAPLACPVGAPGSQRYIVYGLSAHGIECSYKNPIPSQYANIPHLYKWIENTMVKEGFDTEQFRYS